MQISTKFTIAIHLLAAIAYFSEGHRVTSEFLAGSIGTNPVIVRGVMLKLRGAGLIETKRGPGSIRLLRQLSAITFLDVYRAVETGSGKALFHFHEHPNPQCPVGRNIHRSLDGMLLDIQQRFEADLASHTVADVLNRIHACARKEASPAATSAEASEDIQAPKKG